MIAVVKLVGSLVLFAHLFLMKRSIVDYIAEHAARSPDRVAIHQGSKKLSYGELMEAAARCRGALAARGIRPGDRVALVMSDSPQMVIAFLGIMGMGAIAVPCSTMLPPEGLSYVFKDSDANLVIVSPEHLGNAQKAGAENPILADELLKNGTPRTLGRVRPRHAVPGALHLGQHRPAKGAVHRHGHMPWTVESVARKVYDLQPDDRVFSVPRLFFAYGLGNSLSIPLGRASTILVGERPTPALIAEVFEKYRPTVFFAVPTVFRMLLEHARQETESTQPRSSSRCPRERCSPPLRPGTNGKRSPAARSSTRSAPRSCCTRSFTITAPAIAPAARASCSRATRSS